MPKPARRAATIGKAMRARAELVAGDSARYYAEHGRHFPWRDERDPFRMALTEILLQKTRAPSVLEVRRALLEAYPSPVALAKADESEIEALLRPLGLSRKRAAQMVSMAQALVERGDAAFDDWREVLRDVPGIGAYAARAIACFARGEKVGIVDANVARIERRLFRVKSADPRAVIYQRYADAIAEVSDDVRATNFGLLDIGAAICVKKPKCDVCPFQVYCPRYGVAKRPLTQRVATTKRPS
jgi:A/G-specific adenine glycosylase